MTFNLEAFVLRNSLMRNYTEARTNALKTDIKKYNNLVKIQPDIQKASSSFDYVYIQSVYEKFLALV